MSEPIGFLKSCRLAVMILGLALSSRTFAQVDAGSIAGTIRDTSGAVIATASVTLINQATGQSISTTSTSSGEYMFSPIKIGRYSLSAELNGFRKVEQNNITVDVQQKVQVNLTLPVGQTQETVVVNGAPPTLQTMDASVGQVIEEKTINDLPLNGRNYTFLAQLSAGVTQGQQDARGLAASGTFSTNGLRPSQNNYLLDGIDNNSNLVDDLNGTSYAIRTPVDAIAEFKVETGNYSAETGRSAGAVINATIKSGTNAFHGSAWEFIRNDHLDASNYFETSKGRFQQNQFGVTLGGPIRRNRTFFFVDYEGTRIRQAIPSVSTVPTTLERTSGYTNFSELLSQGGQLSDVLGRSFTLGQVFDPSTTRTISCGVSDPTSGITVPCQAGSPAGTAIGFAREPFAGNILPANRLDSNAINLLNLYPNPTNGGLFNNYTTDPVSKNTVDQFDVRVDHKLTEKDYMFGRVSYYDNPEFIPAPFTGFADGGSYSSGNQTAKSRNLAVSESHLFSTSFVNEVRVGYSNLPVSRLQPNADTPGIPAQFGIQGISQERTNGGLGSFSIAGLSNLGSAGYLPAIEYSDTSQITDNMTKTIGRQTLKAGFEWQRLGFAVSAPPAGRGVWSFSGLYTEIPTMTGGNTGPAQLLLTPVKGTVAGAADFVGGADNVGASNIANTSMKHNYYGAYLQDDLRATSKLTVNLGLRWEYFGQLIENNGAQSNLFPNQDGTTTFFLAKTRCNTPLSPDFRAAAAADHISIVCSGQPGLGESQIANFSPRVGLAYQVTPKLVVRAGYGIFYGGFENSELQTYTNFPFQYGLYYSNLTPDAPITFSNGSIATIETGLTGIPLSPGLVEPGGVSFVGEDYHIKTPYTQGYNLTLQYQIDRSDTVQIGYVGNQVHHLASYTNPNSPREILPPGLNRFLYSPYPDFAGMFYTTFEAASNYDGLQMNYERRFAHGLGVLANFTWSSCFSDSTDFLAATSLTNYRAPYLPGFGIRGDRGRCDFDVQKVVHVSGGYELPVGRGRKFLGGTGRVANAIVGGWDANWILTLQDGQPGTIPCAITTTSGFRCFANTVPGANIYAGPHDASQWLNPAAFANPPVATTIGQTDYSPLGGGPGQYRGPGFHRLEFSLFKQFHVSERFRMEFRSEFFNITNHPNFANPGFSLYAGAPPGSLNYLDPSSFANITSTRDGQNDQREIQFALKLYF